MEKPEILSFSFQERYLSRRLIQSRKHLILYLKLLSQIHKVKAELIVFNHDLEDSEYKGELIDNFKIKNSYEWIKGELKNV